MDISREHDIVLHGATGFVGALVAAHLAENAPPGVRITLSGRSREKLERVRAELPAAAHGWPLVVADAGDPVALAGLAASSRVVVSTVGPYATYGLARVEACARAGTHYADLTGEVLFVREAIDRFDGLARDSGARIVHSCGYDSIPSDLGVLLLHEAAGELADVRLVAMLKGGFSGGTVASMRAQMEAMRHDPAARRRAADPHALSPDRAAEPAPVQPSDFARPSRLRDGAWTAPFVMAGYNTRIVRRSNALTDWSYGRGLRYGEVMGCGKGLAGAAVAGGATVGLVAALGGINAAMTTAPTRALLDRVLPAPGSGPSAETRSAGWFRSELHATANGGRRFRAVVAGKGDPGYAATAVMLGQSGLCLAEDALPDRAGSLTPATAMGMVLVERLRKAGHTYNVHAEP
jgi:short subunit dehydrogenase-like uncharacterized protein